MDEHPDNICTTVVHSFEAAWSGEDGDPAFIFCRYCGEVRAVKATPIDEPAVEIVNGRGVTKTWRG